MLANRSLPKLTGSTNRLGAATARPAARTPTATIAAGLSAQAGPSADKTHGAWCRFQGAARQAHLLPAKKGKSLLDVRAQATRTVQPESLQAEKGSLAVVGGGIAGLTLARELADRFDVTVYEAQPKLGGQTESLVVDGRTYPLGAVCAAIGPYDAILRDVDKRQLYSITGGHAYDLETGKGSDSGLWKNLRAGGEALRFMMHKDTAAERAMPWSQYVAKHDLHTLADRLGTLIQGCGYTNGEVPVAYVRQYISNAMLRSFVQHPLVAWENGTHSYVDTLAEKAAAEGVTVKTSSPVERVEHGRDGVRFQVNGQPVRADQIVFTGDATHALELLEAPSQPALDAFKDLRHEDYWVSICRIDGLPDAQVGHTVSSIPSNMTAENRGRPMLWLKKEADTNVYVVWSFENGEGQAKIHDAIRDDFAKLGGQLKEMIAQREYKAYFPHFDSEQLAGGALDRVRNAQSDRTGDPTWFAGMGTGEKLSVMNLTREAALETAKDIRRADDARRERAAV